MGIPCKHRVESLIESDQILRVSDFSSQWHLQPSTSSQPPQATVTPETEFKLAIEAISGSFVAAPPTEQSRINDALRKLMQPVLDPQQQGPKMNSESDASDSDPCPSQFEDEVDEDFAERMSAWQKRQSSSQKKSKFQKKSKKTKTDHSCTNCGKTGHYAPTCIEPPRKVKKMSTSTAMPTATSTELPTARANNVTSETSATPITSKPGDVTAETSSSKPPKTKRQQRECPLCKQLGHFAKTCPAGRKDPQTLKPPTVPSATAPAFSEETTGQQPKAEQPSANCQQQGSELESASSTGSACEKNSASAATPPISTTATTTPTASNQVAPKVYKFRAPRAPDTCSLCKQVGHRKTACPEWKRLQKLLGSETSEPAKPRPPPLKPG